MIVKERKQTDKKKKKMVDVKFDNGLYSAFILYANFIFEQFKILKVSHIEEHGNFSSGAR